MHDYELEAIAETKSLLQQALERETEAPDAQGIFPPQRDPLAQVTCRLGDASCARAHVSTLNRVTIGQPSHSVHSLLQLQRQYGNRYVQRVLAISRQGKGHVAVTAELEAAIRRARGGGQVLDSGVRSQMESAFGADFSGVRVHSDAQADTLNRALNARAFTTGQDIFFRQGAYTTGSSSGQELLVHELTHVVQQTGDRIERNLVVSRSRDKYEQEADQVAKTVIQRKRQAESIEQLLVSESANMTLQQTPLRIQRKNGPETKKPPAVITTTNIKQEIAIRLNYIATHVDTAISSFENWASQSGPGVDDLDAFSKYLRGKATAVFGFFLTGPYAVGATLVWEVITTAVDSAIAAKIKSLADFTKNMTARFKEKMTSLITKKNKEATDTELRKAVGSVDQSKVDVTNHSKLLDAVLTERFKIPDYTKLLLWPKIMENLVEQYLTFYWTKVVSKMQRGIMFFSSPRTFAEEMKYKARDVVKVYRIAPMPSSDPRFIQVKSLLKASNWEGLLRYSNSLSREDCIAIGRNPETKKLISDSNFDYIKKAMARGLFSID